MELNKLKKIIIDINFKNRNLTKFLHQKKKIKLIF